MTNQYTYPYLISELRKDIVSVLPSAVKYDHVNLVKWILIQLRQNHTRDPWTYFINSLPMFMVILNYSQVPPTIGRFIKNPEILTFLLDNQILPQSLGSWFVECCQDGDFQSIRIMLQTNIHVNIKGRGLLMAVRGDFLEIVRRILKDNLPVPFLNEALMMAIHSKANWEIISSLLNAGADIHMENDRPVHIAKVSDQTEIFDLLIDRGAIDINF